MHFFLLLFPYFLATTENFCGTESLCKKATFKDGICDPQNNNRVCGYDGGDCCSSNAGWDSRCKEIGSPLVSTIQFLLCDFVENKSNSDFSTRGNLALNLIF